MKLYRQAAVVALALAFAGQARADDVPPAPPTFTLAVTSTSGDSINTTPPLTFVGQSDGHDFYLASDTQTHGSLYFDYYIPMSPDPGFGGSFTLTNKSTSTQTFTVLGTLTASPLSGPLAITSSVGPTSFTDDNADGTVRLASSDFYEARIDGATVLGSKLGSFDETDTGTPPGVGGSHDPEFFSGTQAAGIASTIGFAFPGFVLSAGDSLFVEFTLDVEPVPEPAPFFATASALILLSLTRALRRSKAAS
jgi:hypothetical protein